MVNDIRAVMFLVIFHFFSFISVSNSLSGFNSLWGEVHGSTCGLWWSPQPSLGLCVDRFSRMERVWRMELYLTFFSGWKMIGNCFRRRKDRDRGEGKVGHLPWCQSCFSYLSLWNFLHNVNWCQPEANVNSNFKRKIRKEVTSVLISVTFQLLDFVEVTTGMRRFPLSSCVVSDLDLFQLLFCCCPCKSFHSYDGCLRWMTSDYLLQWKCWYMLTWVSTSRMSLHWAKIWALWSHKVCDQRFYYNSTGNIFCRKQKCD